MPSTKKKVAALILAVAAGYLLASSKYLRKKNVTIKKRKKRRCWIKKRDNVDYIDFDDDKRELHYRKNLAMGSDDFQLLLNYVEKDITKKNTAMRMAIPAKGRLELTLRFLAAGESYRRLENVTNLSTPFFSNNIPTICEAIYENLKEKYLKFPSTTKEWLEIADLFLDRFDFPLCLGAIYEKKILYRPTRIDDMSISNIASTTILAVTDADFKFIYVEMDCSGQTNETSFFERSKLKEILENSTSSFPPNTKLGDVENFPYMFISDRNIPLHERVLVPYPISETVDDKKKKVFNSRINDARDVILRTFALFSNYFKITKTLSVKKEPMQSVLQACFALHNFLMKESYEYEDAVFNPDLEYSDQPESEMINKGAEDDSEIEVIRAAFAQNFLEQLEQNNS